MPDRVAPDQLTIPLNKLPWKKRKSKQRLQGLRMTSPACLVTLGQIKQLNSHLGRLFFSLDICWALNTKCEIQNFFVLIFVVVAIRKKKRKPGIFST